MAEWMEVAALQDIPLETGKAVHVQGKEIALFRAGQSVCAVEGVCPHEGGPLAAGFIQDGIVTCPWHLWRFDVRTGALLDSPSVRIGCFPVQIEGERVLLDVSSLSAELRRSRAIFQRIASGEGEQDVARDLGMSPEEIGGIVRRIRVGERLVWLGELIQAQGAVHGQDLLALPHREMKGVSYGAAEKLDELIGLL